MSPQQASLEDQHVALSPREVSDLARILSRTLPEIGMDRMTRERVEEVLAVPALTAHI